MNQNIENRIIEILKVNNITCSETIFNQLKLYYDFLIEYNKNVNLTAITDIDDVYLKHFADCMLGSKQYKQNATVCDIGTGAGFPGVIIKIIRPDLSVVLVDSLQKRVDFLNRLIEKLNLIDIVALHYRAEDDQFKKQYLNKFDYVVARAVANMTTLTEYCLPFVKVGGEFVAYKSDNIEAELNKAKKCINILGGNIKEIQQHILCDDISRKLIVITKISATSNKYPRNMNKPRLKPLK